MLYARKADFPYRWQTLKEHCTAVAEEARQCAMPLMLSQMLYLAGLLHDAGKASEAFQAYLKAEDGKRGSVVHAGYGARYAYERWHHGSCCRCLTAELIMMSIACHHGRLPDLIDEEGCAYGEKSLIDQRLPDFDIIMERFFEAVADQAELDSLFEKAVQEVTARAKAVQDACEGIAGKEQDVADAHMILYGLLARDIYGLLIDADRWDAYCFEANTTNTVSELPWERWQARLNEQLSGFPKDAKLSKERAEVSLACYNFAEHGAGIWRLCVPTGGGKTLAVMRYALEACKRHGFERIIYTAPYKTILEQTADSLQKIFGDEALILEHHSDAVNEDTTDEQLRRYQLLIQRWDTPLVLTTMAQFLDTLFAGRSACARRFAALQNSVIILDEAQCLPMRCTYLMNLTLRYLCRCCQCSVVLCTATQPLFHRTERFPLQKPVGMIADEEALYRAFRRVRAVDKTSLGVQEPEELAERVMEKFRECGSALCIMNTKATATALYQSFLNTVKPGTPVYCLTTAQCPAHRLALLNEIRGLLKAGKPVVCVATQLIEAGVDVSFGLTVRALAGLDSIVQAAGRENRDGRLPMGEIWIVRIANESLKKLPDIERAKLATSTMLNACQPEDDLLSPGMTENYAERWMRVNKGQMEYPLDKGSTLMELLARNSEGRHDYESQKGRPYPLLMAQCFRTAGMRFRALDSDTITALVPYGAGKELIDQLLCAERLEECAALMRRMQRYMVNLYPYQIEKLKEEHGAAELPGGFGWALDKRFYDERLGVTIEVKEMDALFG